METDWENLTDPILLAVFSFLDKHELNSICRTCKNWYRIAQDESLWKRLIFRNFGCRYSRHDESWKSEVKRLTYHVPKRLHQTCLSHVDEIYYVCFSNSGKLIATCGADGSVKVWQYGNNTELLHSRQVVDRPSYANYVEFNEAETQVLVNCIVRVDEDMQAILAVLSIEKGLAIVAARNSWFPNFRGTWLHNDTFLIADVLAFFFSNANVKLVACTFYDDLDDPVLLDRPLGEHLEDDNVELRPILEMERDEEYRPHFVKVIDWSKWNQDNLIEHNPNSNLNEKVIILFQESLELDIVHRVVFYKLDVDCEVPNVAEPIKIIVINSGCMGVQLSADHRDIVYNFRRIYVAGDNSCHEKDVHTMAINLASTEEKPEIFTENKALEESSTLFYFFPSISSDFIASGSEQDVAFLWDRHSKLVIAQLPHKLSDPNAQNGVNGVAFHPHDQEVLVSVADDCKLRIWMSANRENHLE